MLPHTNDRSWTPGSATVDGNIESDHPTWVMTACKGRRRIDLASGPLHSRALAQQLADWLNSIDIERWDRVIEHDLRHVLSGAWG
jgi:hypothetical protein